MKTVGIICEYNPFHNGHLYHLNKVKEMFPNHTVILVMSTTFTQHGDPSMINKWDKTKLALELGIDLVIELPFGFTTQSADVFAKGAIQILHYLQVDNLVFGSELNNIETLSNLADITLTDKYQITVKKYVNNGINYPSALSKALKDFSQIKIDQPNDILGICYLKEIKKLNSNLKPFTIKRTNDYHSNELNNPLSSATSIRLGLFNNQDIQKYVPSQTLKVLKPIFIEDYFPYLKYKILSEDNLTKYLDVDEGIENRIKKYIIDSTSIDELINNIKSKRYTYSKLKRMLIHILCDFTKKEAKSYNQIKYIRVLGFNQNGRKYLNGIKKNLTIPIITKYNNLLDLELKITKIYSLGLNQPNLIKDEYQNKPIIK